VANVEGGAAEARRGDEAGAHERHRDQVWQQQKRVDGGDDLQAVARGAGRGEEGAGQDEAAAAHAQPDRAVAVPRLPQERG
jgi:hypothetical protein